MAFYFGTEDVWYNHVILGNGVEWPTDPLPHVAAQYIPVVPHYSLDKAMKGLPEFWESVFDVNLDDSEGILVKKEESDTTIIKMEPIGDGNGATVEDVTALNTTMMDSPPVVPYGEDYCDSLPDFDWNDSSSSFTSDESEEAIDAANSTNDSNGADVDETSEEESESSTSTENSEASVSQLQSGNLKDGHEKKFLVDTNVVTLRPGTSKPNFSLDDLKNSPIASMLPEFLAQIEAANQELEAEKDNGTLVNRRIEMGENETMSHGGQYIELNLGLGVLEEKNESMSTSSDSSSSSEATNEGVMKKLLGGKRKRGMKDDQEGNLKKIKIEEIED